MDVVFWLNQIKDKYIHGGDEAFDNYRKEALDYATTNISDLNIDGMDINVSDLKWVIRLMALAEIPNKKLLKTFGYTDDDWLKMLRIIDRVLNDGKGLNHE